MLHTLHIITHTHTHINARTQWKNSDDKKVHLEKLDFDAGGKYYCEVSTDTPIYTKESNIEQMHIVGKLTFGIFGAAF